MAGIKAGYGVSKKDQLESIVCDHASRKMQDTFFGKWLPGPV